jgi:2'-5' RNA ligase
MRLFTGIDLPAEAKEDIARLLDRLRPAAHVRWTPAYNLHITCKFIGQWPDERVDELKNALQPLGARRPFEIALEGIGWFPNPHSPRILFIAVKAGPEFEQLARDIDAACAKLGIELEAKPFKPHLTMARIKDAAIPLAPLRTAISKLGSVQFGRFTARSFHLYLSRTGPSGSIYTQLAEFPFETR